MLLCISQLLHIYIHFHVRCIVFTDDSPVLLGSSIFLILVRVQVLVHGAHMKMETLNLWDHPSILYVKNNSNQSR